MPRRSGSETGGAGRRAQPRGSAGERRAAAKSRLPGRAVQAPKANAADAPAAKADVEANLDEALDATFPASDPVAITRVDS